MADLHQWRLEALLWILQLLMRRAAALCRYTAFFMMDGSLASISAAQMHSSKNPGATQTSGLVQGSGRARIVRRSLYFLPVSCRNINGFSLTSKRGGADGQLHALSAGGSTAARSTGTNF